MKQLVTSWGRFPQYLGDYYEPALSETANLLKIIPSPYIPRGLGRSYGDSAIAQAVIATKQLKYFISFDQATGLLHCQSGVSLAEILTVFLPQGWFLAVTPGTKYVTVGGAIASDVHGKNHHHAGCFSQYVEAIELLLPGGEILNCSANQYPDIFRATCGGMGLTGLILSAKLRLKKIPSTIISQTTFRTASLTETIAILANNTQANYAVAWCDCSAPLKQLGRALVFLAEHEQQGGYDYQAARPYWLPNRCLAPLLNRWSSKVFNAIYYYQPIQQRQVNIEQYFYPLDKIANWNQLYGKQGFTQYQFVIPLDQLQTMQKILLAIRNYGVTSFLSVLKILGPENQNFLSFPTEGLSLALDFKISPTLWPFLAQLDQLVIAAGGRVYLTKDCHLTAENFRQMYPRYEEFLKVRAQCDPEQRLQSLQSQRLKI